MVIVKIDLFTKHKYENVSYSFSNNNSPIYTREIIAYYKTYKWVKFT